MCKDYIPSDGIAELLGYFNCIIGKSVMPLLVTIAVVLFVYGIIKFFLASDSDEERKKGKSFMLWGIIALFVLVSMWGLVGILKNSIFGNKNTDVPSLQQ